MEKVAKPRVPVEHVEPFTAEQVLALLGAARKSLHPKRDEAIILLLLDTGLRASELCGLTMKNLDLNGRHAYVLGKGNKHRPVYYSRTTAKALSLYLRREEREDGDPVFINDRGLRNGSPLTVSGLRQLIERLGIAAGVKGRRLSPHTLRHTCAIQMLKNGSNVFALQSLLGHRSLTTCQTYLKLSQSDVSSNQKAFSAVEGLNR